MKIDGKALAESILSELTQKVTVLKSQGITPTLAVILIGDNPASLAYIRQKQKAAERIGAKLLLNHARPASRSEAGETKTMNPEELLRLIQKYNNDPNVHGLIVQRPLPDSMGDTKGIVGAVAPHKDVDGFVPNSPFDVPVARAVWEIIGSTRQNPKHIVVIGRGETAGKPIANYLHRLFATSTTDVATKSRGFATSQKERRDNQHCTTSLIHSHTSHPKEIMQRADIIISCVGKERVVTGDCVKPGAMLISVGIWRDSSGKLRGDYNEEEIANVASFYTPTPGGVGPVNVACLMQNLIKACMMSVGGTL
ncbi:MAG: bifunctional 5,10-methylenetetrahydrofolate dehydrogenase/5,10-methenyltetrahydrofolate cyclohydrolase [Patescibacteria group bacterium]